MPVAPRVQIEMLLALASCWSAGRAGSCAIAGGRSASRRRFGSSPRESRH
jgi:hypothetical protein